MGAQDSEQDRLRKAQEDVQAIWEQIGDRTELNEDTAMRLAVAHVRLVRCEQAARGE